VVSAVWLAAQQLLTRYAALALPRSVARELSLEVYLLLVSLVALGVGAAAALLLLGRAAPRQLGIVSPGGKAIALGLSLSPLLFVASSYLAVYLALPTLLEELRRGGADLVRQNAGDVGRAMTSAPLVMVLLWALVVAPIAEELLFRGAIWSLLSRATRVWWPARTQPPSLPGELVKDSWLVAWSRTLGRWLAQGGLATLVVGFGFGLLHWDLAGGQGIIRVTVTTCLGLACGVARQHSGSVLVPIAIHGAFNVLGLAGARRWVVTQTFPTHFMVPTLATVLAGLGGLVALVLFFALRNRDKSRAC
jgi:membrane protease YdiL (CAAX protease family)